MLYNGPLTVSFRHNLASVQSFFGLLPLYEQRACDLGWCVVLDMNQGALSYQTCSVCLIDAPDLGAFANVFAELDEFRAPGHLVVPRTGLDGTPSSSVLVLPSDNESPSSPRQAWMNTYSTPSHRPVPNPSWAVRGGTPPSSIPDHSDPDSSSPSHRPWPHLFVHPPIYVLNTYN